ncbi:MAG: HAMP domain-containing protein [Ardenticatenia bacterium]|nr:HAMP domain-containing protein [Ardenticatenia bacterium]
MTGTMAETDAAAARPRRGASLRLKLLGLTASAVVLALGMAALLTSLQTHRAFDRFVAEGEAAEARRLGDIVTFVYHQGGGLPAVMPLVRHLGEVQGLKIQLRVDGEAAGALETAPDSGEAGAGVIAAVPAMPAAPVRPPIDIVIGARAGAVGGDAAHAGTTLAWERRMVITGTRALPAADLVFTRGLGAAATHSASGSVVLMEPEAGFLGSFRHALLGAALLGGALALVLGAGMARRVLGPIEALTAAAGRLEAGDLSQRVAVRSDDEIGQLGQAFNAMAGSLERQEALRRGLVSDVAHELRTPLTNLGGYLEALRDGVLPASPEQLRSLHEEAQLLGRLVDDLQALAQADAGEQPLAPRDVDVEALIRQSLDAFAAQAAGKRVALEGEIAADLGRIRLDSDRIAQVLRNLLANALTHAPPGGWVRLTACRQHQDGAAWLAVAVSDNGSGIAPEHLPHLFERFYRADPSRSRATGGSGLGLTIARQLTEAHGGSLTAESRPGQGATFTMRLPFVPWPGS